MHSPDATNSPFPAFRRIRCCLPISMMNSPHCLTVGGHRRLERCLMIELRRRGDHSHTGIRPSGNRAPKPLWGRIRAIPDRSSGESFSPAAATFSATRSALPVPETGTMSSPWARMHARADCATEVRAGPQLGEPSGRLEVALVVTRLPARSGVSGPDANPSIKVGPRFGEGPTWLVKRIGYRTGELRAACPA